MNAKTNVAVPMLKKIIVCLILMAVISTITGMIVSGFEPIVATDLALAQVNGDATDFAAVRAYGQMRSMVWGIDVIICMIILAAFFWGDIKKIINNAENEIRS